MQNKPITIFLPILRQENISSNLILNLNINYLWPGLADKPINYWQPDNYPFNAQQAKACLDDLINMGDAALSGVPMHALIGVQNQGSKLKDFEEQDILAQFANTGQISDNNELHELHIRQAAQKFLLWAWLLEERFSEVKNLTEKYAHGAKHLVDNLGVDQEDTLSMLQNIESYMQVDDDFLPPWQIILENAAIFIPNHSQIVINHNNMLEGIADQCENLVPLTKDTIQSLNAQNMDIKGHECELSVGDILHKSERKKQHSSWLNKTMRLILLENK